jgi:8-oxo-dGTP pyrophosphatase MutT (NUDIX family)
MQLHTAGLIVIKDKKLLLAFSKNKQAFYLPGGKVDAGETAVQALLREIKEELNIELEEKKLQYYTHVTAAAYGETNGIIMEQDCFLYKPSIQPQAAAEIEALQYFDVLSYSLQPVQVPGVVMIIQLLKKEGLLN